MSDSRAEWQKALASTPECLAITRFGEPLTPSESAHLQDCPRCQAELSLFKEFQSDGASTEEKNAGVAIATELRRRRQLPTNVSSFKPRARFSGPFGLAAAAGAVIVLGSAYWMQNREPSLSSPLDGAAIYRSTRLQATEPLGEVPTSPNNFKWSAVSQATRYSVEVREIDGSILWRGETSINEVSLPANVVTQFAPGKTLLWKVTAFRGNQALAESGTQRFHRSLK